MNISPDIGLVLRNSVTALKTVKYAAYAKPTCAVADYPTTSVCTFWNFFKVQWVLSEMGDKKI